MTKVNARRLTLVHVEQFALYIVVRVQNSTEFVPGNELKKAEVDGLIQAGWDVTTVPEKTS